MAKISSQLSVSLGCLFLSGVLCLLNSCGDDGGTVSVTAPEDGGGDGDGAPPTPPPIAPPSTPGPDPLPPDGGPPSIELTFPPPIFFPYVVVAGNPLSVTTAISAPSGLGEAILVEVTGPTSFTFTLEPEDIGCVTGSSIVCDSTRVGVLPETSPLGDYEVEITIFDTEGREDTTALEVEVVESGTVAPLVEITEPPEPIIIPALSPLTFSASILPPDGLDRPITILVVGTSEAGIFFSERIEVEPSEINCQVGSVELCNGLYTDLFGDPFNQIPAGNYTLTLEAIDLLGNLGSDQVDLIAQ